LHCCAVNFNLHVLHKFVISVFRSLTCRGMNGRSTWSAIRCFCTSETGHIEKICH
jgi:hypothetical protein